MREVMKSLGILLAYFIPCALAALALRRFVKVPHEVFRKILHMILLGSFPVLLYGFADWRVAVLTCLVFAAVVYPALLLLERLPGYSHLLTERRHGEIRQSLLVVFSMFAGILALCRGWLQEPLLALGAVLSWGLGDCAAALVGKHFGRRPMPLRKAKTWEGSGAMFALSLVSVAAVLLARGGLTVPWVLGISALTSAVVTFTELVTPGGYDTISCPFAAAAVLIPAVWLAGGGV